MNDKILNKLLAMLLWQSFYFAMLIFSIQATHLVVGYQWWHLISIDNVFSTVVLISWGNDLVTTIGIKITLQVTRMVGCQFVIVLSTDLVNFEWCCGNIYQLDIVSSDHVNFKWNHVTSSCKIILTFCQLIVFSLIKKPGCTSCLKALALWITVCLVA